MRFTRILSLATAALLVSATATSAAPNSSGVVPSVTAMAITPAPLAITGVQDVQPPKAEIKVDISEDRTVWYTDPVWLAVGAIALLVIIVLAVMAARGGGSDRTTVVR